MSDCACSMRDRNELEMPVARASCDWERPCSALSCLSRAASSVLCIVGDGGSCDGDKDLLLVDSCPPLASISKPEAVQIGRIGLSLRLGS